MPRVGGAGVPGLSQIVGWDTQHLEQAAWDWSVAAEQWEDQFTRVHRATVAAGGTAWEGDAAEAAQERTVADLVKVRGLAASLHEAAAVARRGADQLGYAKRRVLDAVSEAEGAGFTVRQDLSVINRQSDSDFLTHSHRLALAKRYAATITARAAKLSALDMEIAARIATTSTPLSEVTFTETPITKAAGTDDLPPANQFLGADDIPAGIVVLCEPGPRGGPWAFDCHVFYPGGGADMYPSDGDDSGGYP